PILDRWAQLRWRGTLYCSCERVPGVLPSERLLYEPGYGVRLPHVLDAQPQTNRPGSVAGGGALVIGAAGPAAAVATDAGFSISATVGAWVVAPFLLFVPNNSIAPDWSTGHNSDDD